MGSFLHWTSCLKNTTHSSLKVSVRFKAFLFKKKIAKTMSLKTPPELALEHFDFYYKPLFGDRWPSVRLGLLSQNKFICLVNNFLDPERFNADIEYLKHLGAFDLIAQLKHHASHKNESIIPSQNNELLHESITTKTSALEYNHIQMTEMRGDASLNEFMPATKSLTYDQLGLENELHDCDNDIHVSGFEGAALKIDRVLDIINLNVNLNPMVFDRAILMDFPSTTNVDGQTVPRFYLMDGASLLPILALNLQRNDHFLDVCASPGGKSLIALQSRLPGKIVCNDAKIGRLGTLRRTLLTFLPLHETDMAERVVLKQKDAASTKHWDDIGSFDKVLVDAPCSSDRHSLRDTGSANHLFDIKMHSERLSLPQKQTRILVNGLRSLRKGGSLVYSTCTLSPSENQNVISNGAAIAEQTFGIKVTEQYPENLKNALMCSGLFHVDTSPSYGFQILPFLPSNFGPMYLCKLKRET